MTLPGVKSLMKELESLGEYLPPPPSSEELESRGWMAALTSAEIARGGEILTRMGNDEEPTEADIDFLLELINRPPVDSLPEVDPSQPVCFICGQQPAWERGQPPSRPVCEPCWKHMLGCAYDWP